MFSQCNTVDTKIIHLKLGKPSNKQDQRSIDAVGMVPISAQREAIKYDTLPLKSRGLTRASINTVKSTAPL